MGGYEDVSKVLKKPDGSTMRFAAVVKNVESELIFLMFNLKVTLTRAAGGLFDQRCFLMMTRRLAEKWLSFMCMRQGNRWFRQTQPPTLLEYVPEDLKKEPAGFIQLISDDVDIYKKIRVLKTVPANAEADEFATWWSFKRYVNFPHVLGLI